jgi:predicted DNA-binding transcriptional regulator AlpA
MAKTPYDPYLNQFLTRAELAADRRVSVDTIDRMVKRGDLPAPWNLSPGRKGWRRRDVQPAPKIAAPKGVRK